MDIKETLDNILRELSLIKEELLKKEITEEIATDFFLEAVPDENGMLSKNFSASEIACKCCGVCKVSSRLIDSLQDLRDLVNKPIRVNSSCRCEKHNKKEGGEPRSRHLFGVSFQPYTLAADIFIPDLSMKETLNFIEKIDSFKKGGIGLYPSKNFIHVDVRLDGPARWAYVNGKLVNFNNLVKSLK